MSLRGHREPRARKYIPEERVRRREGAHVVRTTQYQPEVCTTCGGKGHVYDVHNGGDHPSQCPDCDGAGEV